MSRFFVLLVFLSVVGCSGSGGSAPTPSGTATATTTTATSSATCVAAHEPLVDASGSHAVAWTKTYCGPSAKGEVIYIGSDALDDSGQLMGTTRDVNRGRVTFDFTNLDYSDLAWPTNDMMFMSLKRVQANEASEWNWHILGNRYGISGPIETRMVSQRPSDDYCVPEFIKYCEKKYSDTQNPYIYERAKKYQWDCYWNTTIESGVDGYGARPGLNDGRVSCDLFDITSAKTKLTTYFMPTSGPYPRLANDFVFFFVAGGNAVDYVRLDASDGGPSESYGVPMIVSNFRFSILQ